MKLSIIFLFAVIFAVVSFANSTTVMSSGVKASGTVKPNVSPSASVTAKPPAKTTKSSATTLSAMFGVVLSFSFACLLKSL